MPEEWAQDPAAAARGHARLTAYDFPGNVRELRNLVERLAILCEGPVVTGAEAEALLPAPQGRRAAAAAGVAERGGRRESASPLASPVPAAPRFRADKTFRDQVDDAEREIILGALAYSRDNATEAARLLDLERGHFYKKMKALGLKRTGGETSVGGSEAPLDELGGNRSP